MRVKGSRVIGCAMACGLALSATAAAQPSSFVIQGDHKIGGFAVKGDGTLSGAIEEFGDPTSLRRGTGLLRGWNACVARWHQFGLRVVFYNLGGQDSCRAQYGYFRNAVITGKKWRTSKGLRIGHPSRYIRRYYPRARPTSTRSSWWSLVMRTAPYFDSPYVALSAKVMDGSVVAFQVYYQAGGE